MKFNLIFVSLELSFALTSSGPLSVWYGDSYIASASSRNGIWNHNFKVEYMFDGNDGTSWHSERRFEQIDKTMRIDFRV